MKVEVVPCLKDNYAYILTEGDTIAVVDPSESEPVLTALAGRKPQQIWATHHHPDHTGGILGLTAKFPEVSVAGSAYDKAHERVPRQDVVVRDGMRFPLGGLLVRVLDVPGHTLGAVAYVVDGAVFTGDTLFLAGCGRMFEGTPEVMHASLQKLADLPPATKVYVGHEYTENNLKFARAVEPENAAIAARKAQGRTVPGTIGEERETNVFLRAKSAAEFGELRSRKDNF